MRKALSVLLVFALCVGLAFAKGSQESKGPTEIVVWSPWTGNGGACLQAIAEEFNSSQSDYVLELSYQGSYAEILAKFQAADASSRPDGIMVSTEYVAFFIDNGDYYIPVQKFADEDKYDFSDILSNLRASYSKDGELLCVPAGNTVVGFFYNNDLLRENGINPDTDLGSYEEIEQASYKLAKAGVKYPFMVVPNSIYYTFCVTAQGMHYVDNNNGADSVPTRCLINEEPLKSETVKFFQILKNLNEAGLLAPIDYSTADARQAFVNGDIAMICSTISGANAIGALSNWTMDFQFHPAMTISAGKKNHGQCTGGGAIFITDNNDENKARGVWEFLKVLMAPKNTAAFAMSTGYLPTTSSGFAQPEYQEFVKTKLQSAATAKKAQEETESTCYNAWLPEFGDVHQIIIDYMKLCVSDSSKTAVELTEGMAAAIDESIRLYNLTR